MGLFLRHQQAFWNQRSVLLILLTWLLAVSGTFLWLTLYASSPGQSGHPSHLWPSEILSDLPHDGSTLLMFAHPRCPCTRASLRELALILASRPGFRHVHVIFFRPAIAGKDWLQSEIVQQAEAINGVHVTWDQEGRIADEFGAQTSGHVMLYDGCGTLAFSGGITAFRGHAGWNRGREALISIGQGDQCQVNGTPVFGCSLRTPEDSRKVADRNAE